MASAGLAWLVLASLLSSRDDTSGPVVDSSRNDTSGPVVKEEDRSATPLIKKEEEEIDEPLSDVPIAESSKAAGKRRAIEPEDAVKEEDEEGDVGSADEIALNKILFEGDEEDGRGEEPLEASGSGTARESAHARGVQRRRSHVIQE